MISKTLALITLAALTTACSHPEAPVAERAEISPPGSQLQGYRSIEEPLSTDLPLRAVSLRALQQTLAACTPRGECLEETRRLGRLTRIVGYALDRANRDIVIYGLEDQEFPQIHVEDFIVALRSSWMKYAKLEGNTFTYAHPGCDIRPEPKLVLELGEISQQFYSSPDSKAVEATIRRWQQTCSLPQEVSVLGVPFATRFGHVMVKADYDMKSLADGSDDLGIPGFRSMMDIRFLSIEEILGKHRPVLLNTSMNRFWLTAGDQEYTEDEGIVWIDSCSIRVRTHSIGADRSGALGDSAGNDPTAEEFAHRFTLLYPEVAEQRPIYSELQNLFHLYALTQVMKFRDAPTEAGLDLAYLLESYPLEAVSVNLRVPGRHRVKRFQKRRELPGAIETIQFWMPSCGGVEMSIEPAADQFRRDHSNLLTELREHIIEARPTHLPISWNISPAPGRRKRLKNTIDLQKLSRPGNPFIVRVKDLGSEYLADTRRIDEIANKPHAEPTPGQSSSLEEKPNIKAAIDPSHPMDTLDVETLMEQITEKLMIQAEQPKTIVLELDGFSEDKAEIFHNQCKLRLAQQHPDFEVYALRDVSGTQMEEALFKPDIHSFEVSEPVHLVTEGRDKGLYRASLKVKLREWTLTVVSKIKGLAEAFIAKLMTVDAAPTPLPLSLVDLVDQTMRELKQEFNIKIDDIRVEVDHRRIVDLVQSGKEATA